MEEKLKYRYFVNGRSGQRQVFPVNGQKFSFSYNQEDEKLDYTVKLSEKLKFIGEDFSWLYYLEKTIYRCDFIDLKIEKFCGGAWTDYFDGRISLNSGDPWDLDKFSVELAISESTKYDCFDDADEDLNILNMVYPKVNALMISGELERQSFSIDATDTGPPPDLFPGEPDPYGKGWSQSYVAYTYGGDFDPPINNYNVSVEWVREVKSILTGAEPLQAPWIFISSDGTNDLYARSAILYNPVYGAYNPNKPQDNSISFSVLTGVIDNGVQAKKVFEYLLQVACPQLTLESDFFQWNPSEESPINYVTEEMSKVLNLVLFQKSDVKRPTVSGNANVAKTNLVDLTKDFCKIFNLKYFVTNDFKFKLEHVDYFKDLGIGLDTTTLELAKYVAGNRVYSYDKDKIPKNETFRFMDMSFGDFAGANIIYSGSCAGQGDTKDIDYNVEKITTDIQLCLNNPAPDSAVSDDGFVLMALDVDGSVLRESSILGGNSVNNTLAWAQLHRDYWRYERAQKTFLMNNVLTTAFTVKPTKLQAEFKIPFCCATFDPKLFVKSSLGDNGTVKGAKYDIYAEKLSLSLLFPADDGLFENQKPITVGDSAETFKNYFVIIDVIANDSDPDGDIDPSTLAILGGPTHGTAIITDDFKVKYTPAPDYYGPDVFIYNVKDDLKEPSANTIVNITVKDGTPNVIAVDDEYAIAQNVSLTVAAPGVLTNDSGPSVLSIVAETKATDQGGSVIIYANGSFVYTPPTSPPSLPIDDTFTYTVKDINDNMDQGEVTITVFEAQDVYVSLVLVDETTSSIIENCSGPAQIVGEQTKQRWELRFFSDILKTIPLDVTGYGLIVRVRYDNFDHSIPTSNYYLDHNPVGSVFLIHEELISSYIYYGCEMGDDVNTSVSLSLLPGTGYNI